MKRGLRGALVGVAFAAVIAGNFFVQLAIVSHHHSTSCETSR